MAGTASSASSSHDVRVELGGDLWIETVTLADLREQSVNAHVMPPATFQRLVENIRKRGQLESLPYCVSPQTRILTRDLRWVEAGHLKSGDELLSFDERTAPGTMRRWRTSEIVQAVALDRPCLELELNDGTVLTCSEEHQWLVRGGGTATAWRRAESLMAGARIIRLLHPWDTPSTWAAGYLAAAFDGEGYLSQRQQTVSKVRNPHQIRQAVRIGVAQNQNVMLDQIDAELRTFGFRPKNWRHHGEKCRTLSVGKKPDVLRFLGMFRPPRLMAKFDPTSLGSCYGHDIEDAVVRRVTRIGWRLVIAMRTTTGTYVAEGMASHNCSQPNGDGPIEIVSGHHRVRAALAAGLERAAVLIDRNPLTRSQITAKQLAHNAIIGSDDQELVKRLLSQITSVDDLLETGLSEDFLPTPERFEVTLFTPVADYRWKSCTFLFLSHQADDLEAMVKAIKGQVEVVCLACEQQFEPFMRAVAAFAQEKKILSAHTAVALLIKTAKDVLPPPPDAVDEAHAAAPEVQP